MHSAADLGIGNTTFERQLQHTDVDLQFIRDQCLRWIMIDEMFMVPDELLALSKIKKNDSAVESLYTERPDRSKQIFAGYYLLEFGDTMQLPPVPSFSALFLPEHVKSPKSCGPNAMKMLDVFWGGRRG